MTQIPIPVTLTPTTNASGAIEWQMSVNNGPSQGAPYPPITVTNGNSALITFTIQNPGNITFASTPMLVPPKSSGIDTPTVSGASMSVKDHNLKAADIPYVLMFNNAPKLDPIIDNDGGGSLQYFFRHPSVSGGGFFILAILAAVGLVLLLRMLSKRAA